jgi:DNA polymerase I-like protein with 3'-5' exonuclease and polymerase domains
MDTVNSVTEITAEMVAIIKELERNGIKWSDEQSEVLKREHGIDIPSHFIAEYKYRKKNECE